MAFDTAENQEEKLALWSIIFLSLEDELESSMNFFDTVAARASVGESSGYTYSDYSVREIFSLQTNSIIFLKTKRSLIYMNYFHWLASLYVV